MTTQPEVTVVIPTFERWDHIGRALSSALAQRDVELEVVIVDDGTTPMPDDLVTDADRPRVRHLRPPERRGVGHARNLGFAAARSDWVAFLDDDDLWAPDKLRAQLDACLSAGRDWGFSSAVYVDPLLSPFQLLQAPEPESLLDELLRHQIIPAACSNVIARTDLLRASGGFDTRLHQLADWDLWVRIAGMSTAASVADVHVAYVQHPDSMLITYRESILDEFVLLREKHTSQVDRRRLGPDGKAFGFWLVERFEPEGLRRRAVAASIHAAVRLRQPYLLKDALRVALGLRRRSVAKRPPASPPRSPDWLDAYRADADRAATNGRAITSSISATELSGG